MLYAGILLVLPDDMRSALCCRAEISGSPPLPAVRASNSFSSNNKRQWGLPRRNEASETESNNVLKNLLNSQSEAAENKFPGQPSAQPNDVSRSGRWSTGWMPSMKIKLQRQLSRKSAPFRAPFRRSQSKYGARQQQASFDNSNGQQSQRSTWQSRSLREGGYDSDAVALDIPRDLNELLQPGTPEHGVSKCTRDGSAAESTTKANTAGFVHSPLPGRATPPSPKSGALPLTPMMEFPGFLNNHHGSPQLHDRPAPANSAPPSNEELLPMPPAPMLRPQRLPSLPESASRGSWRLSFVSWRRPSIPFGRSIDRGRRVSAGAEVQKNRKVDNVHRRDDANMAETMNRPLPEGSGYAAVRSILGKAAGARVVGKPSASTDTTTNKDRHGPGSGGHVSLHSHNQHYIVQGSASERDDGEAAQVTKASSSGEPLLQGHGQTAGPYDGGNESEHPSSPRSAQSPSVAAAAERLPEEDMPGARLHSCSLEVPAEALVRPSGKAPSQSAGKLPPTASLLGLEAAGSRARPKRRPSIPESWSWNPRHTREERLTSPGRANTLSVRNISPQPAASAATAIATPQTRRRPSLYARSVSLGHDMLGYLGRFFHTPSSDCKSSGPSQWPSAAGRELEHPEQDTLAARFLLLPFPLPGPQQGQQRAGEEVELEDLGRKT